jgi:hypothetical protein
MMTDTSQPTMPAGSNQQRDPRQDAGQDQALAERLQRDPESDDARLDTALDETMDASDPIELISSTRGTGPAQSSGYDDASEQDRREG